MRSSRTRRPPPGRRGRHGFSLVELMVVVSVVAILAMAAVPTWQGQVRRGHRAAAQAWLLEVATRQQQFLLERRAYAATIAELGVAAPASVADRYTTTLALRAGPPEGFVLTAAPRNAQAGDGCGALSIDQDGARLPSGCW